MWQGDRMIFKRNVKGLVSREDGGVGYSMDCKTPESTTPHAPLQAPSTGGYAFANAASLATTRSNSVPRLSSDPDLVREFSPFTKNVHDHHCNLKQSEMALDNCQSAAFETPTDHDLPETTLGEGVSFKGELSFQRYLCIEGEFEGRLNSQGKLRVGKTGVVRSNLDLSCAVIEGRVEGDIKVSGLLELRGSAQVFGNIAARYLRVDDGVTLAGHVQINPIVEVTSNDEDNSIDDLQISV